MFKRISAVVLFVNDFAKCLAFYEQTLGLTVVQREPTFAAFKLQDQDFAIQDIETSADMVNMSTEAFVASQNKTYPLLLCMRVDNVDDAYGTLIAKGVVFTAPPTDKPWGIRVAYFRDTEGNLWEMAHPLTT
jgi:lactoylglutathione lyase